jgi:hypothetical protein
MTDCEDQCADWHRVRGDAVETLQQVLGGDLDEIGELLHGRTRRRRATAPADVVGERCPRARG